MGFIDELKQFAAKGNAVDMAVGILVGGAFTKIVNSVVSDLLMPPIGVLIGGVDFKQLQWVLTEKTVDGAKVPDAVIAWGKFVNNCVEFAIVVLCAFVVVKMMNKVIALRIADVRAAVEGIQSAADLKKVASKIDDVKKMID
ncbi:MAG: large conductance mechanosensitive channel protein MscL [Planctomycetaceae bacterium]|nr:large conductance mechanosensitive channel protein MscL [Planctomycetaceae bacterium]